jgi:hypothetical protein
MTRDSFEFKILDGSLVVVTSNGSRHIFRPLQRDVVAILPISDSGDCVVLSDYRNHGAGSLVNLSCVRPDGRVLWTAEPPDSRNDEFTSIRLVDGKVHAFSSSGFNVVIDPRDGRVLRRTFVK